MHVDVLILPFHIVYYIVVTSLLPFEYCWSSLTMPPKRDPKKTAGEKSAETSPLHVYREESVSSEATI